LFAQECLVRKKTALLTQRKNVFTVLKGFSFFSGKHV